jgi:hypothetical protein
VIYIFEFVCYSEDVMGPSEIKDICVQYYNTSRVAAEIGRFYVGGWEE